MSRVPELIGGVVTALTALPELEAVGVTDGPLVTDSGATEWILVGFDGNGDGDFTAATSELEPAGSLRMSETISLTVALVASRGDTDVAAVRTRVYELYAAVVGYLNANPGGPLAGAETTVSGYSLSQLQTRDGMQARIALTLTARTFTL